MLLEGKAAVITGGSRGIGKAIALKLAEHGADIAMIYAGNTEAAENAQKEILALKRRCEIFQCDVSDFLLTKNVIDRIIENFGGLDILVNNAGIIRDNLILRMSEDDFDRVIDINLKGAFNMIKHTYAHFAKKRQGSVINVSSIAGLMGNIGQINYSAAKAGLIGMTKTAAKELALRGVRCNAIAPGFIETDMTDHLTEKVKQEMLDHIPLKRIGKAEDIANAALFLAGDCSSYITGEILRIDGGLYI